MPGYKYINLIRTAYLLKNRKELTRKDEIKELAVGDYLREDNSKHFQAITKARESIVFLKGKLTEQDDIDRADECISKLQIEKPHCERIEAITIFMDELLQKIPMP